MSQATIGRSRVTAALTAFLIVAGSAAVANDVGAVARTPFVSPPATSPTLASPPEHTPDRMSIAQTETTDGRALEGTRTAAPCPGTLTANFTFTSDLTCNLDVTAPDVTVDLAGHTLFGRIHTTGGGTTIRNGTIDGASVAPFVGVVRTSSALIDNIELRNGDTWAMVIGGGTVVQNSRFRDNASVVFDLFWGGGNVLRHNLFQNSGIPISIQLDSDTRVERNVFAGNQTAIILWPEHGGGVNNTLVRENVFLDNGTGIHMRGRRRMTPLPGENMANSQFLDNIFAGSDGPGMSLLFGDCGTGPQTEPCAGKNTTVRGNTFVFNGYGASEPGLDDGLHVSPDPEWAPNFTVSRNTALLNADLGIEASGAIDGGHNLGLFNGDRRQCVGVRCGPRWLLGWW